MNTTADNVLLQQQTKGKHGENTIVLFRCGDFYRSYNEDADIVQRITGSCGFFDGAYHVVEFPKYGLDVYLPMMVRRGYRVCITDGDLIY